MDNVTVELTFEEACQLRQALNELSQVKKINYNRIIGKLIGSTAIWPGPSIHEVEGCLPLPRPAKPKAFRQQTQHDGRNFIILTEHVREEDKVNLFGDEPVIVLKPDADMIDILVVSKIFPSRGQARKNGWKGKETIPKGWTEMVVGKKKHKLFIWNPNE